ncbi:MAG TPA: magnesium-translocating P-type ATPase [Candidatus Aminicenantes bacterium]|nr:magnesium-translocating P-type ATPase [Candidatus Aminicenantes bacterium]HRY65860.1 magnesium-translocating P-type ATPase [Candidatus Aminicenantes bacterium]HRZ72814.1 magnesium-translocating P-type ATPase [Candidatus Aminicenantes bacterium]
MPDRKPPAIDYWSRPAGEVLAELESGALGLTSAEAKSRLETAGPNALKARKRTTAVGLFLRQFASPLVLILLFGTFVSALARDYTDALVILAIVVGSAAVTFAQEYAASQAVEKLRARLAHRVTALRDGAPLALAAEDLVPGDVLVLAAGSLIPADGRLLEAKDFFVSQAALTGETFPLEKTPGTVAPEAGLAGRTNCVFAGTNVRSGTARVLVAVTGAGTAFGRIADRIARRPPETEFERGIRRFGLMLSEVMIALILVVFGMNILSVKPPIDSLLFAIALAVGISPELLPAIITINLSKGARDMARGGVIVRRLNAIENLGSMDTLCTDKTGTLTAGAVELDAALDADGAPSAQVLHDAALNAGLQTGLANPLDQAIAAAHPLEPGKAEKLDEVPYDFVRKRLSVVVREGGGGPRLVAKGALEPLLDVCASARRGGAIVPLDAAEKDRVLGLFARWSEDGYRVLGVAVRDAPVQAAYGREDERGLTFAGFLRFFDPPKPDVLRTIEDLAARGVRLKIVTGDNRRVAESVARRVGLEVRGVLTGSDLEVMREEALVHAVGGTTLFAEMDPNDKERVIRALQKAGHVVGYMGDGINDAPALHDADVGISVDGAVDVAREAADIVLLEPGLDMIRRGVEEGRVTFANSLKYIFMTTSANFGNMLSLAAASVALPFLPLLAKQVLLNNFLTDIPALAIAGDNVDPEWIRSPRRWDIRLIRSFMFVFGLTSSLFDVLTFGLFLLLLRAGPEVFRTGWFIESVLTELLAALVVRTRRPFFRSRPGRWLLRSSLIVMAVTLALPYLPGRVLAGFTPLPAATMGWLAGITVLYVLATEAVKRAFYARRGL